MNKSFKNSSQKFYIKSIKQSNKESLEYSETLFKEMVETKDQIIKRKDDSYKSFEMKHRKLLEQLKQYEVIFERLEMAVDHFSAILPPKNIEVKKRYNEHRIRKQKRVEAYAITDSYSFEGAYVPKMLNINDTLNLLESLECGVDTSLIDSINEQAHAYCVTPIGEMQYMITRQAFLFKSIEELTKEISKSFAVHLEEQRRLYKSGNLSKDRRSY